MRGRLLGLETEYAIRYSPAKGTARPTNLFIYERFARVIGTLVATRRGPRDNELFVANGGVVHYEAPPYAQADGLVEGGTPECRSPSDALLYQRAQDALLARATPLVKAELEKDGYRGDVGLLKNCRDADGHIYGAQENYELDIAAGGALVGWRAGLVVLAPLIAAANLVTWAFVLALIPAMIAGLVAYGVLGLVLGARARTFMKGPLLRAVVRAVSSIERVIWEPPVVLFLLLYRAFAFRRVRRAITPFLVSRQVITGAGTLVADRFALSEKAVATRRLCRAALGPARAIFDAGNLCKALGLAGFGAPPYAALFARRQRMQLGLSDSNMAQSAEYLKIATTCLVIDMAEAGVLDDMHLRRPIRRLHAIAFGDRAWAIGIQREYVARARTFVRRAEATSLEARQVVERWSAVLDAIEHQPEALVGSIDWITKQYLLERAGSNAAARKKIDLKYHELDTGYFAELAARGLAPELVGADEIARAQTDPPSDTPARARARLMRELGGEAKVTIGWKRVRVGGPLRGHVISLFERDRPPS